MKLRYNILTAVLLLSAAFVQAQTPFWSEDFSDGIPGTWANADGSNHNVLWGWCNDPAAGNGTDECPGVFTGQDPFAATTATSGFANLDSDQAGQLTSNHISRLTTSAIDCSQQSTVFISFQTQIGVYTLNAQNSAILRVSTDNTNWTTYTIFPGFTTLNAWSDNPAVPSINISATAANKSTVYIQWQWTGNYEYVWNLDDIKLFGEDPTPKNELKIGSHFYPVSSFATPVSQIATDSFGFSATVSNLGSKAQPHTKLKATVTNEVGDILFADSVIINSLPAGYVDSFLVLGTLYAPELPTGTYFVNYFVSSDSVDQRPVNNTVSDPFVITTDVFSKENGPEFGTLPADPGDWAVGNYYRMSSASLEQYKAVGAAFSLAQNDNGLPISDISAPVYLLKLNDDIGPNFEGFDNSDLISPSFTWVGNANFDGPDGAEDFDLQEVELFDLQTGTSGVPLETGARYFLVIEYAGDNAVVNQAFSSIVAPTFVSTVIYGGQWYLGGFGDGNNAVLRMYISLATSTDEKPLADNVMTVFPNPISTTLNLGMDFAKPTDATITIAEMSGRVVTFEDRAGLTNEKLTYELPQLAAGTYLARVATKEGTLTKKFVVVK